MSRQFDEVPWTVERGTAGTDRGISVDLAEHDAELVLTADVPGFEKDDIHVECTESRVEIRAERDRASEEADESYIRRERSHRSVRRSVDLPAPVAPEQVRATYRNGVLTLTLPKTDPTAGGHEIDIE